MLQENASEPEGERIEDCCKTNNDVWGRSNTHEESKREEDGIDRNEDITLCVE